MTGESKIAAYWLSVGEMLGSAPESASIAAVEPWMDDDGGVRRMLHRIGVKCDGQERVALIRSQWTASDAEMLKSAQSLSESCSKQNANCGFLITGRMPESVRNIAARMEIPVYLDYGGRSLWSTIDHDHWSVCPACGWQRLHVFVSLIDPDECFSDHDEAVCPKCRSGHVCCLCGEGDPVYLEPEHTHACPCGKQYEMTMSELIVRFP